jgi:hypothetical protein
MSRWAEAFAALSRGSDTLDTLRHSAEPAPTVSQSVNSVIPPPKPSAPPAPVPVARNDTWTDAQEERAAIVEYDGGAPRAWAEALARLDPDKPPGDAPPRRWLSFIDDCGRFLDRGWAARAAAFGWGPLDLFGCDRERPFARLDHMGLLWLVNGGTIVELHRARAIIETAGGAQQGYRRRPVEVGRVVLAWELSTACQK